MRNHQKPFLDPIKLLIYGYLLLLIFEGALRKWVFPSLSNPLLIVRDPLAMLIYAFAIARLQKSVINSYVVVITFIGIASFALTMVMGHGNLFVAVFGFRALCLHFPLIFVIGYFFDKEDVILVGKGILLLTIPMTLLLILQFSSPQSAFVNRAPGGELGMGLTGALGKYRPPGTFSYITGVVQFYTLASGFLLSAYFERKYFPLWMVAVISGAVLIAVPISISRTLFLSAAIVLGAGVFGVQQAGGSFQIFGRLIIIPVVGFLIASQFSVFDEGIEAFSARWENSTSVEQGGFKEAVVFRFFDELTRPFVYASDFSLAGRGLGIGTQAGAKIETGQRGFLVAEGEWDRMVIEMGSILGIAAIFFRSFFTYKLGHLSFLSLKKKNLLPWLLFTTTALLILNGQWGQPTTLGFMATGSGLCLAAMRSRKRPENNPKKVKETPTTTKTIHRSEPVTKVLTSSVEQATPPQPPPSHPKPPPPNKVGLKPLPPRKPKSNSEDKHD